jgi:signal transduction histidine kinase
MLLNLLDNAIKYNHANGIVKIFLTHTNGSAELEITNTGPVIPAEALPRIFDRFYRGDPSHNSTTEGNGLGLSIVQWIVSAHKGTIVVTSDTNQGTKVLVTLPLKMLPQN